jgi:hypothetical protein
MLCFITVATHRNCTVINQQGNLLNLEEEKKGRSLQRGRGESRGEDE